MINKKIYNKLKELASRKETINYSQLASDCDIDYTSVEERNLFHEMLGEISIYEVKHNRPMLSVLVHHKGDIMRICGKGFFQLADELEQRKEGEDDMKMMYRILKEVWACNYTQDGGVKRGSDKCGEVRNKIKLMKEVKNGK